MRHLNILPLCLLVATAAGAPMQRACADKAPAGLDLSTGRIRMDDASQGAPFTLWSASEGNREGSALQGGQSFYGTTTDYAYRGGTMFDPRDYVVAAFRTYNRTLTSRVYVMAGLGIDYAAFAGQKSVAGLARTAGAAWRVVQSDQIAVEAQLRWTKYSTPGEDIAGLAPMVRLRWQLGR